MGARTGKEYFESIRKNQPEVYLNGNRVDVATDPAFAGPIKSIMEQYDLQFDPRFRDICLYESPTSGELVSSSFMVPRSREDLVKRRRHFKIRSDHHFGTMGRSPDFMNVAIVGWELTADYYGSFNHKYGVNAKRYAEHVREHDLFLTHVLVNPQIDRSRTSANQEDPFFHLGRVGETSEGIIVRGAKMLGTMAPLTEELLVVPFGGVAPGDDAYALVFAIPTNTPGVKFICRESYSGGSRTLFDHPLSSRFEEMDCIAVFDNVLIPWDRLIVDGSAGSGAIVNGAPMDIRAPVMLQTISRLMSCMELLCGVATRLADAIGITGFLHVQEKLGQMLLTYEQVKTAYYASDAMAFERPDGYWVPYVGGLVSFHMIGGQIHQQFVEVIQTLAGGGFFYAPTEADMQNKELRPYIDKYVRGRPGISAEERIKLFKLAWDLTGEAFGQRLRQYVKYYTGDPIRNMAGFYLGYDKQAMFNVVDRVFAGAAGEIPLPQVGPIVLGPPRAPPKGLTSSYPANSHPTAAKAAPLELADVK